MTLELFTCDWCEQTRSLLDHISVPCPHMDDDHSVCTYCVAEFATEEFKQRITEHGDNTAARSGRGIDWAQERL